MVSATRRALEDFDNQHDLERLAADVLNALGYSGVQPMAPAGGPDGGIDIKFRDGEEQGQAFVTLEKRIREKFSRDLQEQTSGTGVIAFFCVVDVSPAMKNSFTHDALSKGFRLEIFDLERLRSLLDASLKDLRRRYLGIEDDAAALIRSRVKKLLKFPDAVEDGYKPKTTLESCFSDHTPGRLFHLLNEFDDEVVAEVPTIGSLLHQHLADYYSLRQDLHALEERMLNQIDETAISRLPSQWRIQLYYNILRISGQSPEEMAQGANFLNYGMTWESAERAFVRFSGDVELQASLKRVLATYSGIRENVATLATRMTP